MFIRKISLLAASILMLSVDTAIAEQKPQTNVADHDALTKTKSRFFDDFSVVTGVKLSSFKKVFIRDPLVSFDKDWIRDNRINISKRFQEKTITRYAALFKQQLRDVFEKDERYTVVDQKADGVLIVAANIADLDIYGPDEDPLVKQYVYKAGEARLQVSLSDVSGKTLATIEDLRETREIGHLHPEKTSSLQNERDFKHLMKKWARKIAQHIANN
ncbi:MAG: DUF3313 domain-containing protein [Agarilytica sp.]